MQAAANEVRHEQLVVDLVVLEMEDAKDAWFPGRRRHGRQYAVGNTVFRTLRRHAAPRADELRRTVYKSAA